MNKIYRKLLVVICILSLIGASVFPLVSAAENKQKNNKKLTEEKETINIKVYDFTSKKAIKTEKFITPEQQVKIINAFLMTEMTEESFYEQSIEKLKILQENELITPETASALSKTYKKQMQLYKILNKKAPSGLIFDVANIFNIIFFAVKAQKEAFIEINFPQFEFFNGTISLRFALFGGYNGVGGIFSIGILGFRKIYEYDKSKYPEFPHMPNIKGANIGFVGVFIDMPLENQEERFYLGSGTTIFTIWNYAEE